MKRLLAGLFWVLVVLFYGALRVYAQTAESNSASKVTTVGPLVYFSHIIDDVPGGTSTNGDGDGRAECGEHVGLSVTLLNQGNQTAIGVEEYTLTCPDPDITIIDADNCWPDIPGGQTRENACNYEFQVNPNLARSKTVTFTMAVIAQNGGPWTSTFTVQLYGPDPTIGPVGYASYSINDDNVSDSRGDGDGRAEGGERIELAVALRNQGSNTANGITAVLSTTDSDVTIVDNENYWPDIPGGATRDNLGQFVFDVNNPSQSKTVTFFLTANANTCNSWTSSFSIPIYPGTPLPTADLVADRVYLRSAPNGGGSEVNDPLPGQQYYVSIEYRNTGAATTGNFRWEIKINGSVICFLNESVVGNSNWVRDCANPVIWPCSSPGASNTIQAVLDVNNSVAESNEGNNTVSRSYVCPSSPSDLVADRVYLRSAPNGGGSEVNDPLPGQQYYASIEYRNTGAGTTGNFRWEVKINGNLVCFLEESVVGNSNWVRHCANPIIWPCFSPGASNTLQAVLDVNNSVAESNESNNSVSRIYICPPSCQLAWKVDVTLQDAGSNSALLSFGVGATATNDIDPACGEAELPPAPPTGIFDARLELPVSPAKASLKDYRNSSQQVVNWRLKFQPGVSGNMTFAWNSSAFPAGCFLLKDEINGTLVNVDMKTQSSYVLTNLGITSLKIEYSGLLSSCKTCRDVNVAAGWNIVSIPVLADNMTTSTLFLDATSQAFAFNNGYTNATTLANGKGYWIKFNTAKTYNICGTPVTSKRIPVVAGWNIIGPFETDIPVANITSSPANIITSSYFGYNNGYTQATTLSAGKGYWVKASVAGDLILPGSAMAKQTTETEVVRMVQQSEVNAAWPMLVIADSKGNSGRIYLAPATEINTNFEMPPVPPSGIFDVRFSSGRYVENLEKGALEIQINSSSYPIRIRAKNLGDRTLNVKDALGGNSLHETLTSGKEIVVSKAIDKIMVETAIQLPSRYALSQNYPNPFNPTTMIRFAVPEKSHVKLTVYSVVGEKLAELVNQELPAGYHQVEFNANNFASGVYFYEMRSGSFRDLKKLLLQK